MAGPCKTISISALRPEAPGLLADFADLDDFLAARFQNRANLLQRGFLPADVINQLAVFRRGFASGEWAIEEAGVAPFRHLGRRAHCVGRHRAMGHDDMVRRQVRHHSLHHLEQRIVIGNEDLDVIAELRDLRRRTNEIRHRSRRPVPNKNVVAAFPQITYHSLADNAQPEHTYVFSRPTRHVCEMNSRGFTGILPDDRRKSR